MTIYLHTQELLELVEAIDALDMGSGREGEWVEAHGVCVPALLDIADSFAQQMVEDMRTHHEVTVELAISTAYMIGAMLGLHAAERIGR